MMSTDKVEAAKAELVSVEQELAALEGRVTYLRQRYEQLRHFIKLAETLFDERPADGPRPLMSLAVERQQRHMFAHEAMPMRRSVRDKVTGAVEDILRVDGPTKSVRELLSLLQARGTSFDVENPAAYLSVLLSRDDRFVSDRATGWSLKTEEKKET